MAVLFSFWSGQISWMERLCVESAKRAGHTLTLFSYEPERLRKAGLGARVEDAREVYVCDRSLTSLKETRPDYFSDHFRLEGIAQGRGTWTDLDFLFLKPLPETPYLFGWENDEIISNAVLRLPVGCDLLNAYLEYCRERPIKLAPPWWPMGKRIKRTLKNYSRKWRGKKPVRLQYGPVTLTHFAGEHGLLSLAVPREVLFPVMKAELFYDPKDRVGRLITPKTSAVHLWHRYFIEYYKMGDPPPTSWIGKQCREFGLL